MGCTDFEQGGPAGDLATRGRVMHKIMEQNLAVDGISDDDAYAIEWAKAGVAALKALGWSLNGAEVFIENERLTGNLDSVFANGKGEFLYADYKFGFVEVEPDSAQMAGGAELLYSIGAEKVFATVIQPTWLEFGHKIHLHEWTKESCQAVVSECLRPKRQAFENCRYCLALGTCSTFREALKRLSNVA
jgi:hypothetical protein